MKRSGYPHTVPLRCSKYNSSVIRRKGESQNGGNKKTKQAKFSEKRTFLTPPDSHTYVRVSVGKTCFFFLFVFGKLGLLCFLVTFVLRFALLSYSCLLTYVRLLTLTHTYVFLRIRTCAYQWVRRSFFFFFFSENLVCFVFLLLSF